MVLQLVASLLACTATETMTEAPPPQPEPQGAALVVLVVVDQLSTALLERALPMMDGGIARMTTEGWAGRARYPHASLLTAPGHATLSTGASPAVHGIIGNSWVEDGVVVTSTRPEALMAPTIGDVVAAGQGRVASLSYKDRGAVLLGGPDADLLAWWDRQSEALVARRGTSRSPMLPAARVEAVAGQPWVALYPERYAALMPDAGEQEDGSEAGGITFPHPAPGTLGSRALRGSPAAGTLLTDAAIATVTDLALGTDSHPDLLTVSYSHTDYVGHAFGPKSWEAVDNLVRLDDELQRLFDHLDDQVGPGRYAVVLTADHGAADRVEQYVQRKAFGERMAASLRPHGIEVRFVRPHLFLQPNDGAAVQHAIEAARSVPGVAAAVAGDPESIPPETPYATAIAASLYPPRSGDVYVLLEEGGAWGSGRGPKGMEHGTPYDYDAVVPLLAMGPGVGDATPGTVDARQIAPELAALLGVQPPAKARQPRFSAGSTVPPAAPRPRVPEPPSGR